jgi:broad specificity phosphatase PhoE
MNNTTMCWVPDPFYSEPTEYIIIASMMLGSLFPALLLFMNYLNSRPNVRSDLPFDIKDKYYDKQMKVMGDNKIIHRVILVRHGQSEHNKRHDGVDCEEKPKEIDLDLNTCLTSDGKEQAKQVGKYLSSFDWSPDIIRISPMKRTRQTAEPFLRNFYGITDVSLMDNDMFVLHNDDGTTTQMVMDSDCMEVNTWHDQQVDDYGRVTKKETYKQFIKRVRDWKDTLEADAIIFPGKRMQTLAFTHSMVISELLNLIVNDKHENGNDDEWSKTYWQVNHCSITCLDFTDKGEWHVHTMNYSHHLSTHTGTKAPFV